MSHTAPPTPEELREEVERTREDLAATVDELAGRLDVKSRVREAVTDDAGQPKPAVLAIAGGVALAVVALVAHRVWGRGR